MTLIMQRQSLKLQLNILGALLNLDRHRIVNNVALIKMLNGKLQTKRSFFMEKSPA